MPGNQRTVLLIEHDPDLRELADLVLTSAGYRVISVPNGTDPVAFAARTKPKAAIVGIRPREPADWDIVDRLLTDPATSGIPLVIMSTAERLVVEAQAAPNVRQTVVAPYDINALEAAVASAIGNPPAAAILPPRTQPVPSTFVAAADALNRRARLIVLATVRELLQTDEFRARFPELTHGLIDNLAIILGAIVEGLRRGLTPDQVFTVPEILKAIRDHDQLRHQQGIPVEMVIREGQLLRSQVHCWLRDEIGQPGLDALAIYDVSFRIAAYFDQLLRIVVVDYCTDQGHPSSGPVLP